MVEEEEEMEAVATVAMVAVWRGPLRMPAAYEIRLAAQPSRSARMHGMPPPTAASQPIFALLLSAIVVSSAACTASMACTRGSVLVMARARVVVRARVMLRARIRARVKTRA